MNLDGGESQEKIYNSIISLVKDIVGFWKDRIPLYLFWSLLRISGSIVRLFVKAWVAWKSE